MSDMTQQQGPDEMCMEKEDKPGVKYVYRRCAPISVRVEVPVKKLGTLTANNAHCVHNKLDGIDLRSCFPGKGWEHLCDDIEVEVVETVVMF